MKIGVIGTGYVGLVTGVCFAELNFKVLCLDIVPDKIKKINQGIPPIYEIGLEEALKQVLSKNLLEATLDRKKTILNSDVLFICLPTPSNSNGDIDLQFINNEAIEIGKLLKEINGYKTIVVKSTVIPGTTSGMVRENLEQYSGKSAGKDFGLAMNPEFLMEGLALKNFKKPDRIIIGAFDDKSYEIVASLYSSFDCEILRTNNSGAEMIKYAANSFLATKISFINEIANMCEEISVNVSDVAQGIGLDLRINPKFLRAGVGFGGSCFPKDVKALNSLSKQLKHPSNILPSVIKTNEIQPLRAIELLEEISDIKDKKIALLGLAFKPDTDDMREAPSIKIATELIAKGAIVRGYDPIAKETARQALPNIQHCSSINEVLSGVDAAIIVTEWNEFTNLSVDEFSLMKGKAIVDGRRIIDWKILTDNGFKIKVLGQSFP